MTLENECFVVAVQDDLGSVLLVPHVESCHVHHLRLLLAVGFSPFFSPEEVECVW